jgi:hypothetical protein
MSPHVITQADILAFAVLELELRMLLSPTQPPQTD